MDRSAAAERTLLGFLGYGALSFVFSSNPLAIAASATVGGALHFAYFALRPLPWKRYLQDKTSACVSVTRDLYFRQVAKDRPDSLGFIRIQNVDRKELFKRLDGRMLNPETIPYHMRVAIEKKESLDLPWEAVEPHLRPVPATARAAA